MADKIHECTKFVTRTKRRIDFSIIHSIEREGRIAVCEDEDFILNKRFTLSNTSITYRVLYWARTRIGRNFNPPYDTGIHSVFQSYLSPSPAIAAPSIFFRQDPCPKRQTSPTPSGRGYVLIRANPIKKCILPFLSFFHVVLASKASGCSEPGSLSSVDI